ncbi:MAG: hypothetical protein HRU03_03930 [Nanoarchaeales archaeon]|nr:hypothetical protein [Nanoarchaeales archaeon]
MDTTQTQQIQNLQRYGITSNEEILNKKIDIKQLRKGISNISSNKLLLSIASYNDELWNKNLPLPTYNIPKPGKFQNRWEILERDGNRKSILFAPDLSENVIRERNGLPIIRTDKLVKNFAQNLTNYDVANYLVENLKNRGRSLDNVPERKNITDITNYVINQKILSRPIELIGYDDEKFNSQMYLQIAQKLPLNNRRKCVSDLNLISGMGSWETRTPLSDERIGTATYLLIKSAKIEKVDTKIINDYKNYVLLKDREVKVCRQNKIGERYGELEKQLFKNL